MQTADAEREERQVGRLKRLARRLTGKTRRNLPADRERRPSNGDGRTSPREVQRALDTLEGAYRTRSEDQTRSACRKDAEARLAGVWTRAEVRGPWRPWPCAEDPGVTASTLRVFLENDDGSCSRYHVAGRTDGENRWQSQGRILSDRSAGDREPIQIEYARPDLEPALDWLLASVGALATDRGSPDNPPENGRRERRREEAMRAENANGGLNVQAALRWLDQEAALRPLPPRTEKALAMIHRTYVAHEWVRTGKMPAGALRGTTLDGELWNEPFDGFGTWPTGRRGVRLRGWRDAKELDDIATDGIQLATERCLIRNSGWVSWKAGGAAEEPASEVRLDLGAGLSTIGRHDGRSGCPTGGTLWISRNNGDGAEVLLPGGNLSEHAHLDWAAGVMATQYGRPKGPDREARTEQE